MNHEAPPELEPLTWQTPSSPAPGGPQRRTRGARWVWIALGVNGALTVLLILLGVVLAVRVLSTPHATPATLPAAPSVTLASTPSVPVYSPERVAADKHGLCMVYDHPVRGLIEEMQKIQGENLDIGSSRIALASVLLSRALDDYPAAPPELRSVVEKYVTDLRDITVTFDEEGKRARQASTEAEAEYTDMCKGEKDW